MKQEIYRIHSKILVIKRINFFHQRSEYLNQTFVFVSSGIDEALSEQKLNF